MYSPDMCPSVCHFWALYFRQVHRWTSADMSANHHSYLLKQLDQQRRQELFCDCNVLVGGRLFRAHRNILFGSSGYFRMLLSQGARESLKPARASFDAFTPDTFATILDFVYSGHLALGSANVIEVMSAASYLQMDDVIAYCKAFIESSLEISVKEETEDALPPQSIMWEPEDDSKDKDKDKDQGSDCQPVLELGLQDEQVAQFEAVSEPRRRGTRKRSASHRYSPDESSPIDLQRATTGTQKADELYATLPTIVGVVGVFNKGEHP